MAAMDDDVGGVDACWVFRSTGANFPFRVGDKAQQRHDDSRARRPTQRGRTFPFGNPRHRDGAPTKVSPGSFVSDTNLAAKSLFCN